MTLGKLLNFSGLRFPHPQNGNNNIKYWPHSFAIGVKYVNTGKA